MDTYQKLPEISKRIKGTTYIYKGEKRYWDGNRLINKERKKEYYEKNKEKAKEYYEKNKEKIKEKARAYNTEYREKNKEKIKKYRKKK
jgi:hypothetical protein